MNVFEQLHELAKRHRSATVEVLCDGRCTITVSDDRGIVTRRDADVAFPGDPLPSPEDVLKQLLATVKPR